MRVGVIAAVEAIPGSRELDVDATLPREADRRLYDGVLGADSETEVRGSAQP
jgi:hypothetical protein